MGTAGAGCKRERDGDAEPDAAAAAADGSGPRPSKQHKGSTGAASPAASAFASVIDVDADSDVEVAVIVPTPLRLFPASQLAQHESSCPNRRLQCGVCHGSYTARVEVAHNNTGRHLACMRAHKAQEAANKEIERLKRENERLKLVAAAAAAAGTGTRVGMGARQAAAPSAASSRSGGAARASRLASAAASASDSGAERAHPAGNEGRVARKKGGQVIGAEFTDLVMVPTGIEFREMAFDAYKKGQDDEVREQRKPTVAAAVAAADK